MYQSLSGCSFRHVAIVLCLTAVQFTAPVHSHPQVAGSAVPRELEIVTTDGPDLGPRQDIPDGLARFPSGPLNQLLRIISSLPVGEKALDAVGKILTPLQQRIADQSDVETTQNGMASGAPCADVTVIFARGTTEPGNVGLVAGPPFFEALEEQLGERSLAVQGVEYPATFAGFNQNGTDGIPSMTKFINQAIATCPDTKIVLSGYSQGALVLRSTAETLPAETMAEIDTVLTFGDPRNPEPLPGPEGKTMIICQDEDSVCAGGFINVAHLTYGANATMAAQFVVQSNFGQ